MDSSTAVKLASKACDTQAGLARLLGVAPPTVAQWALPNSHPKHRPIPARHCKTICRLVPGVMVWHLRPSDWRQLWPEEVKRAPKAQAEA